MKKHLKGFIIGIVVLVILLGPGKNFLIKGAVEGAVSLITGLKLSIGKLDVGLSSTQMDIEGLKLFNPKGFQDKVMVDLPKIFVDYRLGEILKGKIYLEKMELYLREFSVIKNEKGELNLDTLTALSKPKPGEPAKKPETKKKAEEIKMQIDSLVLRVDKVIYKDYSGGGSPKVQEFSININEKFQNITSPNKLVSLILYKVLMGTTIGRLANIDLGSLEGAASEVLATGQKMASQVGEQAKAAADMTQKAAAEAGAKVSGEIGALGEKTSETADAAKEKAAKLLKKLPFGN
jgi:hypothetical protein